VSAGVGLECVGAHDGVLVGEIGWIDGVVGVERLCSMWSLYLWEKSSVLRRGSLAMRVCCSRDMDPCEIHDLSEWISTCHVHVRSSHARAHRNGFPALTRLCG
jgi:hypothetical protein